MEDVLVNLKEVRGNILRAAQRSGRNPAEIQLVAVTKTVSWERVAPIVQAGVNNLGENRVQELLDKYPLLPGVSWHLIGHLQTNKVKYIGDKVQLIHSLDRWNLADELNKRYQQDSLGNKFQVLVQVNISGEESKYGLETSLVQEFIKEAAVLPGLQIRGLMTMAPYEADSEKVRPVFRELRKLAEDIRHLNIPGVMMEHLSMGMSNDYQVAVEEGATLVRVGSGIFGSRN